MKKVLALILSIVIIMSVGVFAATAAEGDYTDTTEVIINKNYSLVGAGTSPAETFTLTQVGDGVVTDGDATSAPALGTITGAAFVAGDATATGTVKPITIALPTYTQVGVYEYTLREVAGTTAGVTYFGNDIRLVVTVIYDETNNKIRVAGVHTEAEGQTKSNQIDNTYSAGTLNISKTVTGMLGDKDKYFEFTVTLTGESGKDYAASYAITGGSYETNPTSIVVGTPTTVYLKDGETLSIANLPYGVEYTVVEADYTAEANGGYDAPTVEGDEGTINAADQTAAFTNNKGGTPDTGVLLDSLPYVIIIGLVAVAGIVMLAKRRRAAFEA